MDLRDINENGQPMTKQNHLNQKQKELKKIKTRWKNKLLYRKYMQICYY